MSTLVIPLENKPTTYVKLLKPVKAELNAYTYYMSENTASTIIAVCSAILGQCINIIVTQTTGNADAGKIVGSGTGAIVNSLAQQAIKK
jgi:hypothetical protein